MYGLIFLLLCFFDSSPKENILIEDFTDFVEINHVYQLNDKKEIQKRFIQIIWWEWRNTVLLPEKDMFGQETGDWRSGSGFVVRDYRIISSNGKEKIRITPHLQKDRWISLFYDEKDRCLRRVVSKFKVISHTMYDKEIINRKIVQQDSRNKLTKPDTHGRMIGITREIEELIDTNPEP